MYTCNSIIILHDCLEHFKRWGLLKVNEYKLNKTPQELKTNMTLNVNKNVTSDCGILSVTLTYETKLDWILVTNCQHLITVFTGLIILFFTYT